MTLLIIRSRLVASANGNDVTKWLCKPGKPGRLGRLAVELCLDVLGRASGLVIVLFIDV